MIDDQEKVFKKDLIDRLDKAKGRLQQSFPEIQQLIQTSNVVEAARKLIDPAIAITCEEVVDNLVVRVDES